LLRSAAVVDASPLIFLARTGLLEVLRRATQRIVVPSEVAAEVRARAGRDDEAVAALATAEWLHVAATAAVPHSIALWDLGPGESATIAIAAQSPDAVAVLDDRPARACAAAHRVRCIGTLGLLLAAKRRGELPAVRPHVDALVRAGFFLSAPVREAVLRQAEE
jgi:predicted nucleic acid-binding protein